MNAIEMLAERAVLAGATAENVPSPCVSVCRMDAQSAYCEGCLRTIDEIRVWGASGDAQKKAIWVRIAQRIAVVAAPAGSTP